ncbi:MAG: sensor histidine kinase [Deltaproteobacteria bacterium]
MLNKMWQNNKTGLTGRITLIIILVAVLSAAISGLVAYLISRNQFAQYVDRFNVNMVQRYSSLTQSYYLSNGSLDGLQDWIDSGRPGRRPGFMMGNGPGSSMMMDRRILITDPAGIIVADSEDLLVGSHLVPDEETYSSYQVSANGKIIAAIQVFSPLKQGLTSLENSYLTEIKQHIAQGISLLALISLLTGIILARRITQPINKLSSAIHEVARGNLGVRIDCLGDREFRELAGDFNRMAEELYSHEQNRNTLFANIAHELRTPLSIMRGNLEAIQSGNLEITDEVKSGLVDEIIRLTRLVKDLETIGQAEAGQLRLNPEPIGPTEIAEALLPLRLSMEEAGIVFTFNAEPVIKTFKADRQRLIQVLINLLTNAMRHVPAQGGIINLSLRQIGQGVEFRLQDNGPGIASADMPHVFDRFYRADESRSRVSGGTGLGLAIARSYVEAHGGRIRVESQPGQGAVFYVFLPQ